MAGGKRGADLGSSRPPVAIADERGDDFVEFGLRVSKSETQPSLSRLGRFSRLYRDDFGAVANFPGDLPTKVEPRRFFLCRFRFFRRRIN